MITAIVTSDNHLGVYYARLRPERLEQRRRRLQEAFAGVVDAAILRKADLFLHAGDLFDRPDPRNAERCFVARQIRRLQDAGIPMVAIAGNHDSPRSYGYDGGILPHEEMEALGAIHLLRESESLQSVTFEIDGQRVCVRGMSSDFNRPANTCPLEGITEDALRGGDIDLVLLHYGVEGWAQPFAQEPCLTLVNLDRLQADAICVGHLHARAQKRLPGGAVLLNPGATEHINFGEERLECGYWVLHCEAESVQTEYVPLPTQPMRTVELDLEEIATAVAPEENPDKDAPDPFLQALNYRLEQVSGADQLLRLQVKGRLARQQFQALDLGALQAQGNRDNFLCQLETEGLVVCDALGDLPIGFGVSFDAADELQSVARELGSAYGDNPLEQEICRLAGEQIAAAFARRAGRQP